VIVAGNLFLGGTGKTPFTIRLARELAKAGYRPGIVCSGYGGRRRSPGEVRAGDDPAEAGDEAVLLASSSGCPVWSGRDRAAGARGILRAHPACDVLLCDDGLQHYRLARDFEIEIVHGRGHGNGLLLPAGPLREHASRRVDAKVDNLGPDGTLREGAFAMKLVPDGVYPLGHPAERIDPASLKKLRLHAVAGIGDPQRFFDTLASLGLTTVNHAFPDHHAYTEEDLVFDACDAILMTEKDAVKCVRFPRSDIYALRVTAEVDPSLIEAILTRLKTLAGVRRSPS
jgi:tetraacyldisaccharide 4'-kinase